MKKLFGVVVLAPAFMFALLSGQALAVGANANAANKIHVSGSTALAIGPAAVTLSSTNLKMSNVADVLIEFNAECSLGLTDFDNGFVSVSTIAQGGAFAFDSDTDVETDSFNQMVKVWVEIDGVPVPVDPSAAILDNGQVNFCSQRHDSTTFHNLSLRSRAESFSSSSSFSNSFTSSIGCSTGFSGGFVGLGEHRHSCNAFASIETQTGTNTNTDTTVFTDIQQQDFSNTVEEIASANSFRWFAFDLGHGNHLIEVKAILSGSSSSTAGGNSITTVVGRRTTVVSPLNNLQ